MRIVSTAEQTSANHVTAVWPISEQRGEQLASVENSNGCVHLQVKMEYTICYASTCSIAKVLRLYTARIILWRLLVRYR